MKKRIVLILLFLLWLAGVGSLSAEVSPIFIKYEWSGGKSPIKHAEVQVTTNGQVDVKYQKHNEEPLSYQFTISKSELSSLRALVKTVKFFDQPEEDSSFAMSIGKSALYVRLDTRERLLTFRYRPEMQPLTQPLWRLIQQGIVTREIDTKGNVYETMVACSPLLSGWKVYRPQLLADPLKQFIEKSADRQKLEWSLTGLAWILTQGQWLSYISAQSEKADANRKALLLSILGSHPFYGSIPETHVKIMLPYLTYIIDSYASVENPIARKTDEALGALCRLIGAKNYEQALPTLQNLIKAHPESVAGGWAIWAIESIESERLQKNKLYFSLYLILIISAILLLYRRYRRLSK